jgi:uncharacterized membrane protein (GlpM family)
MLGPVFLGCFSYLKVSFFSVINKFPVTNNQITSMFQLRSDTNICVYLFRLYYIPNVSRLRSHLPVSTNVCGYVVACMFECYCGLKVA